jgi:hypothetical protein
MKTSRSLHQLLRWSGYVPASDVEDPLGLNLRGLARLGERLLHCITSITPRARYFSFIPWCIFDYQNREQGKPYSLGLRDAIVLRENAYTLANISHHKGETCSGGSLVGSNEAKRWFRKGYAEANLKKLRFAKNPALDAYFTSLVNLGCFVPDDDDDLASDDDPDAKREFTFDDIKLSAVGLDLAKRYDSVVGGLPAVRRWVGDTRRCSVKSLAQLGRYGGLCDFTDAHPADRSLLRDLFFGMATSRGGSHRVRRQSLLLLLDLCRQFSAEAWELNDWTFASAVYFGEVVTEDGRLDVKLPPALVDIATRWRMFYFHHFMGVALEGLFCWLITQLDTRGLAGAKLEDLVLKLNETSARDRLSELFHCDLTQPFGEMTPSDFFAKLSLPHGDCEPGLGTKFDLAVRSIHRASEDILEAFVRDGEFLQSSVGLALPLTLLATTLTRFARWKTTKYGNWLASVARDPYVDLVPPVLASGLSRQFEAWWHTKWAGLATFILSRYVVRQHQSMSYEKTLSGDRCLVQVDGERVFSSPGHGFEKIGMGNPRLGSAVQILIDLGLMERADDWVVHLTTEGKRFLRHELKKEGKP